MSVDEAVAPRFPHIAIGRAHYESTYLKACHPDEPLGMWIRYTIRKSPGQRPMGSVWCTVFESDGPTAVKVNSDVLATPDGSSLAIGDHGSISARGASGSAAASDVSARWNIRFSGDERPLAHLPYAWMYRAPLPKTKSTSPRPDMRLNGSFTLNGREISLDGWRGMLGHNWGTEHAHRWIWLQASGFAESPDTWLDVVLGRLNIGPFTTPWVASGVISHAGVRHRIGGPHRARATAVREYLGGNTLSLPGDALVADVEVTAPQERFVGWRYADPAGGEHQVRNCSIASMALTLTGTGSGPTSLHTAFGATYELGTAEFDDTLPMQPYPDQ